MNTVISASFDTIELWHMIGVRAPASPHDPARIRRKTTFAARAWLTPPISNSCSRSWPSPMPWRWSQIACTEVLEKSVGRCLFSFCPTVDDLAFGLDVHGLPEVHATGSTVLLASRVTEMSNRYVVTPTISREDGHYVNIVTVSNVGDGLHQRI